MTIYVYSFKTSNTYAIMILPP